MVRIFGVLLLFLLSTLFSLPSHAVTQAGTRIVNQAEATYFDSASGHVITVLSNYAAIVVAPYIAHEQNQNTRQYALVGQPVYFPHTIINTGNIADAYKLAAENQSGDNGDLTNLKIYLDENGDGQVNPGEPLLTQTKTLLPGEQIKVVVVGMVPAGAKDGDQFIVNLTSTSLRNDKAQKLNIDTVTIGEGAVMRIGHSTDVDCSVELGKGRRVYNEANFTNIGNAPPAERLIVIDGVAMPGALIEEKLADYVNLVQGAEFMVAPVNSIRVVMLANQKDWITYSRWDGTSKVAKVGVLIPASSMKPHQSGKYGYTIQVIKQPPQRLILSLQATMDENGDGNSDFQSDTGCSTLIPETPKETKGDPGVVSGKVFDSADLNRIADAKVELFNASTKQVIATTTSDSNGVYTFKNIGAGQYYLRITPPNSNVYTGPSVNPPSSFPTLNVVNPSYGLQGYTASGATPSGTSGIFTLDGTFVGMLIDIPLDRKGITGQISIEKSASKTTVAMGDLLSYTIKVRNLTKQDLFAAYIQDQLPYGFKYLSGTAKLNGNPTEDPALTPGSAPTGVKLAFRLGKFAVDGEFTLTYITQVTTLATDSEGVNTAYAHANTVTNLTVQSPTARAHVDIKQEGVMSDRAILFGRIALEPGCKLGAASDPKREANGWPLANVRLYMEDGTYVVSDSEGQYSLYGLKPGLHVLKVDSHTVPVGVVLKAVDTAHAGDPDSRFVDLMPGDFHRADFVALCPESTPAKTEEICKEQMVDNQGQEWVTRTVPNIIPPLHFDSGRAEIKPEYMEKLRQLVDLAKDKQNVRLGFIGHTDNQRLKPETKAKFKDNPGLSQHRAREAAEFVLQNLGRKIDITTDGKGESQPVASNATPEGMAQNRRVEIVLIYDEPVEKHAETLRRDCTTRTVAGNNLVAQRIMARIKAGEQGWYNEMDMLDPGNIDNLGNLARQAEATQDGDISNGLMEAYQNRMKQHQQGYSAANGQTATADNVDEKEPMMPLAKEAVKTITGAQGKASTWLWPLNDTSLDGRFMIVVPAGITPTLMVNGKAVGDSHLGEQIVNKREEAQVLAWYGVDLQEGENQVKVVAKDNFGNERVMAEKTFKRPAAATAVKMSVDGTLVADGGRSTIPVKIQVVDNNGYAAKGVYFLTIEASDGTWVEADIQDKVPGHQIKVTGGERIVHLRSSSQTGQIKVRASTGTLQSEADVSQIAEMRPLVAVGMLDLRLSKGYGDRYDGVALEQLKDDNSGTQVDGRAALFMKGKVKGDMHMTLSYDNKKDPDTELLRDIDPQAYYQVYGDSSLRGYEAQSRSHLYMKLEKDRNSVMWGDYLTDNNAPSADIAKVQRTLTGTNSVYDDGKNRVQVFAARQDNLRGTEEIPGNGTALNFQLKGVPLVRNSEVVEVVTRDRANSGLLVKVEKLERFRDYSIDEVTGRLTFHRTIPTVDDNLNPVFVRVSYDREQTTDDYIVAGVRAETKVTDEIKVGASYTKDDHPTEGSEIVGAYTQYKNGNTSVEAGVARMEHNDGTESGKAVRVQATQKWDDNSHTDVTVTQADAGYTNTSSGVQADRREIKVTHEQKLNADLTAKAEVVDSESLSTDAKRRSAELSATTRVDDWRIKGGVRRIEQSDENTTDRINTALVGVEKNVEILDRKGTIKAEHEREIGGDGRQRTAVGADMDVGEKTKAYVRYENADQLAGGTLAGAVDTQNSLVAGVKTEVLPSTEMYSEYRVEGDISGQDVVAVNGGKATLNLDENLVVTPSLEFMNYLDGSGKEDSIAASVGVRDTRDKDSKKLLRLETRQSDSEKYYGLNGTYVAKVNEEVTAMVGDQVRFSDYKDGRKDSVQNTLTLAAAYRPEAGGPYNALYAYKWKKDTQTDENTHILSTHQNYRLTEDTDLSGHVAAKQQKLTEDSTTRKSTTVMAVMQAQTDVTNKLGVDVHGGVMSTTNSDSRYMAGAGVNYNVMNNVRVGAGYNVAGVEDSDLDPDAKYRQGGYVGLQVKADESLFGWLEDGKCKPRYMVEREQLYNEGKTPPEEREECKLDPEAAASANPVEGGAVEDKTVASVATVTPATDAAEKK